MYWTLFAFEVGNTLLLTMTSAIREGKQDAWMAMGVAGGGGILIALIATRLSVMYPNQTVIEYSRTILGTWPGKVIVIPFLLQWYVDIGVIMRDFGDFIITALFHNTPIWGVVLLTLLVVVYLVIQGGPEGIGRCSEVIGPVILLMIVVLIALDFGNIEWRELFPVYVDSGWRAIAKGSTMPLSFFGESMMILMLTAFLKNPQTQAMKAVWGVATATALACLATIAVIATFGAELSSRMWYPFFSLTRFISIMEFIQNVDSIFVIVWFTSMFIKLSVYVFVASYGTAQWLNIQNWRKVLWVVAPFGFITALSIKNVQVDVPQYYMRMYWIPFVLPINMIGIPLLLLIIGLLRSRTSPSRR